MANSEAAESIMAQRDELAARYTYAYDRQAEAQMDVIKMHGAPTREQVAHYEVTWAEWDALAEELAAFDAKHGLVLTQIED